MLAAIKICIIITSQVRVFYVKPDDYVNVSCPSQPCATLSQYLLDNNGTLPVVSNVEYYFLPGEHHLPPDMTLENLNNVTLLGISSVNNLSPVMLVCCPNKSIYYLFIAFSDNIKIVNVVFKQCLRQKNATYVSFHFCISCKLDNIIFSEGGFLANNLFGNTILSNISIKEYKELPYSLSQYKIVIQYADHWLWSEQHAVNTFDIISSSITSRSTAGIKIKLGQVKYNVSISLRDTQFYDMHDVSLHVFTEYTTTLQVENCTFMHSYLTRPTIFKQMINIVTTTFSIAFVNCTFYQNNKWDSLIGFAAVCSHLQGGRCLMPQTMLFDSCKFVGNGSPVAIIVGGANASCMVHLFIIGPSYINENIVQRGAAFLNAYRVEIKMIGPVVITRNIALNIIVCRYCMVLFSKNITFTSNVCDEVIDLQSPTSYILVMEYGNIVFTNNTYHSNQIILLRSFEHGNPYRYCGFQFLSLNITSASIANYNITFRSNIFSPYIILPVAQCQSNFHHFTTHCRWIPSSVFYGYSPGVINQQIIQTDQHPLGHHTTICYCSHNITNCSVDILGPVYPGQVLHVDFCVPNSNEKSVVYVETHNTQLPASACKIAHQNELLNTVTNYSKSFNFTIVTKAKQNYCELFLTKSPCLYSIYEAFYVGILPCPVGFSLKNGVCDCDPYLSNSDIHINTCYIDNINQLSHVLLILG